MDKLIITKIYKFILDVIFPINCLSCYQEGDWICAKCWEKIKLEKIETCPRCQSPSPRSAFCENCQITSKMQGIIVAASYENKLLQKAVHYFKYHNIKDLQHPLGKILLARLNLWGIDKLSDYILIPIPLHKKKQKLRGYNQAELLANALNLLSNIKIERDIIKRIKNTSAQAKLSPLKRRKNIKNAFNINPDIPNNYLADKKVLIIDDVCTTSSTLEECAKEISKLNPREIWGLVLARGK